MTLGSKVSVLTANNLHFTGTITALTTMGCYVVDDNKKYRQDQKGEWFSFSHNTIKLLE